MSCTIFGPRTPTWLWLVAVFAVGSIADQTYAQTGGHYPVNISMQLEFFRTQDPNLGDTFSAKPSFLSQSPSPTTTNRVYSPHKAFYYECDPINTNGTSFSYIMYSLDAVMSECTNGLWTLSINDGSPTQQVYSFQVSINGLNTNVLQAVKILNPTNGATVFSHPPLSWSDPAGFASVGLILYGPNDTIAGVTNLSGTATNWPGAPVLLPGGNRLSINYVYSNAPGMVSFTTPVDTNSNPVEGWSTTVNLHSTASSFFSVSNSPPASATMLNPKVSGGNFQFSFQSQNGVAYDVLSRTNLELGSWQTNLNLIGDGTLQSVSLANTNKQQFFRLQEN